ncbi:MAG: AfsR/SARP family transcriptional regulator [Candidatus Limnocylindrales bacterium]
MVGYEILGPIAAHVEGRAVDLGGARARAVLAILLVNRNAVVSVDRIVDLVWSGDSPPTATAALQNLIARLRRLLGPDAIETRPPGYVLRVGAGAVDVERFEALVERARTAAPREAGTLLREALGLWRGPAIADLASERFAEGEIARLEELRLGALEARIDADLASGRHEAVVGELEALVAEHPYRERLHGQRILALYRSGRQAEALASYRAARTALDEGLGIDPGPELQALEIRILQQDPALAAPIVDVAAPSSNLGLDPIIGRTRELAAVELALAESRLVTITGLGGIGKTRLALAVVGRLGSTAMPARFVDLSVVGAAADVPGAIAAVLGVGESGDVDLETAVAAALSHERSLLLLDNLEHVLDSRRFIAALLERAGPLRILATSRIHLGIKGERELPLDPLSLPDSGAGIETSDAGRLFLVRSRERGRLQTLNDLDAAAAVEICHRLEGLPLSLELAAAWTRVLSPRAIVRRMEEGRLALTGVDDARQTSLDAVVDATLGLLDETDRVAFGSLAVFVGGFDEPAATVVTGVADILPVLRRLEEVALIRTAADPDGEPRFGFLETIRTAAAAILAKRSDQDAVRRRHAGYFAARADDATDGWRTAGDLRSPAWLSREEPNLRAASDEAVALGDAPLGVRLAAVTGLHLMRSGRGREGLARLERAMAIGGVPPSIRSEGLATLAWLHSELVGPAGLDAITREAVEQARAAGATRATARAVITRASLADPPDAEALFREGAELAVCLGFRYQAEVAYNNLAEVEAGKGRLAEALQWYRLAHRSAQERGDAYDGALFLANMGELMAVLGQIDDAIDFGVRSVAALRAGGSPTDVSSALCQLAASQGLAGRHAEAAEHLAEAADLIEGHDSEQMLFAVFLGAAVNVLAPDQPERAAQALGSVDRWADRSPLALSKRRLEAAAVTIEEDLGQHRFEKERHAGREADPRALFDEIRTLLPTGWRQTG